jgi:hypothetical protein
MCLTAGRYFIVLYSLHGSVVYVLCVLTLKAHDATPLVKIGSGRRRAANARVPQRVGSLVGRAAGGISSANKKQDSSACD